MRLNEKSKEMSIENHMLCDGWIETWKLKLKEKNMNEWVWLDLDLKEEVFSSISFFVSILVLAPR
jgi:hypothetical protein